MLIQSPLLLEHGFAHGFSCREGGVSKPPFDSLNLAGNVGDRPSDVEENRRLLAAKLGDGAEHMFEVSQVHGRVVLELPPNSEVKSVREKEADALVSRGGEWVAVRVADCLPLLLADTKTGAAAAVHVGWRGAVAGIAEAAIRALGAAAPTDLLAVIGPHIRVAAFEIGDDVAEQIEAAARGADVIFPGNGKSHADLSVMVRAHLEELGVLNIDDVGGCTYADGARFFSFRRDGAKSGRQAGIIRSRAARL